MIYKSVIRPIFTYVAPLWYKAAKTHMYYEAPNNLKTCLKIIKRLPIRFSTGSNYPKTQKYLNLCFEKAFDKSSHSARIREIA